MRCLGIAQLLVTVLCAPAWGADLLGTVVDSAGRPIAGARIDISTAAPKSGPALFCPSCYLDCAKSTRSDDRGRFEFKRVSDSLQFRLVATAPGKQTALTDLVDPAQSTASITLADFPSNAPPNRLLHGTVLSTEGIPVSGALVSPAGAKTNKSRWRGGARAQPAVTDDTGQFRMYLEEDYLGVDLEVTAYGYPGAIVELLAPGETAHSIRLPSGVTVSGRLTFMDAPAAGRPVAVVQVNRGRQDIIFVKAVSTTSAEDGSFQFQALPANDQYAIFSPVALAVEGPAIQTALFSVGKDGTTRDLGTLHLVPPLTLAGRLELTDKEASLPPDVRVTLARMPAWDQIEARVAADGRFCFANLPPESYEVRISNDELEIIHCRLNYQLVWPSSAAVRLASSLTDLVIPVQIVAQDDAEPDKTATGTRAEAVGQQVLSGKVVDRQGEPVAKIHVSAYLLRNGVSCTGRRARTSSREDGTFVLGDLPNEPVGLYLSDSRAFGYPVGDYGKLVLYPSRVPVVMNQNDIHVVFDPSLREPPPNLD